MKTKKKKLNDAFLQNKILCEDLQNVLYFDIETTGFSAEASVLYMVGFLYYEKENFVLEQIFSESKEDEKQLVAYFQKMIEGKKSLICYNGTSFDLPYLKKRGEILETFLNIANIEIIDFYRIFSSFKKIFQTENLKQPTMEFFIGVKRKADKDGGELIPYYVEYLKAKVIDSLKAEELSELFFIHNENDLIGLFQLTKLYLFVKKLSETAEFDEKNIRVSRKDNFLSIQVSFDFVPNFQYKRPHFLISGDSSTSTLTLSLSIITGEMKFFYEDYKNYYYLPKEDTAIHKHLAKFMEKEFRKKARPETSYIRVSDTFVWIPEGFKNLIPASFKKNFEDPEVFAGLSDVEKSPFLYKFLLFAIEEAKK